MEMVMFVILASVAVLAGVGVVAQRSAIRSALFLLVNMCCLAGLYILLNAQFVAIAQIIIYAGAVVVLFLFVVMLLGIERAEETPAPGLQRYLWLAGALLGLLLAAGVLAALLLPGAGSSGTMPEMIRTDNIREIGGALLSDFAIPFELASVVLLVAIIGAVVLAKKRLTQDP